MRGRVVHRRAPVALKLLSLNHRPHSERQCLAMEFAVRMRAKKMGGCFQLGWVVGKHEGFSWSTEVLVFLD